jgi:hypothetical protein
MTHPDLDMLLGFLGQSVYVTYWWGGSQGTTLTERVKFRYADEEKIETEDVARTPLILKWSQVQAIRVTPF